jgi:solute carrier family 15 oligopeptide transporter 1
MVHGVGGESIEEPVETDKLIDRVIESTMPTPTSSTPKPKWCSMLPGPPCVRRIIANEFSERFSFYGLRALLVLFLTDELKLDNNTAVAYFMYFGAAAYAFPIVGGYLADAVFGKYKTILIFSLIYATGSFLLAVSSAVLQPWLTFFGLALIAVGTGNDA